MSHSIVIIERKLRRIFPIVERTLFYIRFNFENIRSPLQLLTHLDAKALLRHLATSKLNRV